MAFTITLYTQNSEINRIKKALTQITTMTGSLKEETSIVDPVILVEGTMANFVGANYIYIPEFRRYYYIHDIISVRMNLIELHCHCDVLMSFSDAILAQTGIVARQENNWNLYLDDGSFKTYSNPMILTKAFPSGFTTQSFALVVAGS